MLSKTTFSCVASTIRKVCTLCKASYVCTAIGCDDEQATRHRLSLGRRRVVANGGLAFRQQMLKWALLAQVTTDTSDFDAGLIFEQDPIQIIDALLPLYLNATLLRALQVRRPYTLTLTLAPALPTSFPPKHALPAKRDPQQLA